MDWNRYYELFKKDFKDFTEEEKEFFKTMYHAEEVMNGLDGER